MSRVSSEHLEILRLPELRHQCEKLGVPKSGNKGELISRLVTARISYDNLLMDDLKDILDDMELPVSGNKSELIARIIGCDSSASRGASSASEVRPMQSEVIRCIQRPSAGLTGTQWLSVALSGHQWHSEAIKGHQKQSETIIDNQWPSVAINRNQWQSRGHRVPRLSRWPRRVLSVRRACACARVRRTWRHSSLLQLSLRASPSPALSHLLPGHL